MTGEDLVKVAELDSENLSCWAISHFKHAISSTDNYNFVAKTPDQTIIGFVCGQLICSEAEIHKIAVAKKHRNQGVGFLLLSHIIEQLNSLGDYCFLEVRSQNFQALALYKKTNFKIIGTRKKYYSSPTDDATIMKLQLNL